MFHLIPNCILYSVPLASYPQTAIIRLIGSIHLGKTNKQGKIPIKNKLNETDSSQRPTGALGGRTSGEVGDGKIYHIREEWNTWKVHLASSLVEYGVVDHEVVRVRRPHLGGMKDDRRASIRKEAGTRLNSHASLQSHLASS
jgi:hypothetical protein